MGCDDNGLRNQDDEPKYGGRHGWTVELQRADTVLKPKRKGNMSFDTILGTNLWDPKMRR
jgi:hypothetical protein